jgi:hypothetical protein
MTHCVVCGWVKSGFVTNRTEPLAAKMRPTGGMDRSNPGKGPTVEKQPVKLTLAFLLP